MAPAPSSKVNLETLQAELAQAKAELAKRNTRIANLNRKIHHLTATAAKRVRLIMPKRLHREIRFHLHSDRIQGHEAKLRADKALAEFNALKVQFSEE